MPEPREDRVAVYIDFDNIVISRYDQLHGGGQFHKDKARRFAATTPAKATTAVAKRLEEATVDIGAVLDFASSFGSIALSRAYADWSVPVNAGYQRQLIERAVDLTQLFPTVASMKNGADIRLAVDVVEDLFRLPELTHVVIVAGDSDYIALAQRCKRLGRYVVGIGVAGGTSKAFAVACNDFADYDSLPGIKARGHKQTAPRQEAPAQKTKTDGRKLGASRGGTQAETTHPEPEDQQEVATTLLVRALQLGHAKDADAEWLHSSGVKSQMKRIDPSFQETGLGYRSFSDFVKSRNDVAELDESNQVRRIRLRPELLTE